MANTSSFVNPSHSNIAVTDAEQHQIVHLRQHLGFKKDSCSCADCHDGRSLKDMMCQRLLPKPINGEENRA
jgi:pullulanase/glycogen debranching enzyme